MAIDDTDDPTKRKQRPNDPTGIPSPLIVDLTAPGGVVQSGNRMLYVPPTGNTMTNFPTDRDVNAAPRQTPLNPMAHTSVKPAPAPAQPLVNALTSNAQLDALSRSPPNTPGRLNPTTGKPELDPLTAQRLALTAQQGGPAGDKAQQQLQDYGIAASTNTILGKSSEMIHAMNQKAAMDEQSLPPAERKLAEKDRARAMAIYTQQREQAYAEEVHAYKTAKEKHDLNMWPLEEQRIESENKARSQATADAIDLAPLKKKELEQKVAQGAISLEDQRKLQSEIAEATRPLPGNAGADAIANAKQPSDIQQPVVEMQRTATLHGIPEPVANMVQLGQFAGTYANSLELMQDSIHESPQAEAIRTLTGTKVLAHISAAKTALAQNLTPDEAVNQILTDVKADPSDKGYTQLAHEVSEAVLRTYKEDSKTALTDHQAGIAQSKAAISQSGAAQLAGLIPQLDDTAKVAGMIADQEKRITTLTQIAGRPQKQGEETNRQISRADMALNKEYGFDTTVHGQQNPKQVRDYVLSSMYERFKGDPKLANFWATQKQRNNEDKPLDPAIQPIMDAAEARWSKSDTALQADIKKKKAEYELKEAEKDEKFQKEMEKNIDRKDPEGKPLPPMYTAHGPDGKSIITFATRDEYIRYVNSGTYSQEGQKKAMEELAKQDILRPMKDEWYRKPGYQERNKLMGIVDLGELGKDEFISKYPSMDWDKAVGEVAKWHQQYDKPIAPATQSAAGGQVVTEQTATMPDGTKLVVRDGKWVPR